MVPTNYWNEPMIEVKDLYWMSLTYFMNVLCCYYFLVALNFICYRYKLTVAKLTAHQISLQWVGYFLCGLLNVCRIKNFME
jgi:hypothetical protein